MAAAMRAGMPVARGKKKRNSVSISTAANSAPRISADEMCYASIRPATRSAYDSVLSKMVTHMQNTDDLKDYVNNDGKLVIPLPLEIVKKMFEDVTNRDRDGVVEMSGESNVEKLRSALMKEYGKVKIDPGYELKQHQQASMVLYYY